MRQSRLMSLVEAVANVVVGLLLAVATQIVVFPTLRLLASLGQNLQLALVLTGVSIARNYAVRWLFSAPRGSLRRKPERRLGQPRDLIERTARPSVWRYSRTDRSALTAPPGLGAGAGC